ncbi:MAG: prepilin-type N-terminal cleavage/methylation domain-containing protein [Candidatus Firestonebacteria bacterium]
MKKQKGFTLIELMIVIAIIGLLIAIVIPDLLKTRRESEIQSCSASLRGVQSSLELYYTHYKYYPEKLITLITEGYLSEGSNMDPWHMSYEYQPLYAGGEGDTGSGEGKTASNYLLGSNGPDGKKGSDDDIEPPINPSRHSLKSGGKAAAEETDTPAEEEVPAE